MSQSSNPWFAKGDYSNNATRVTNFYHLVLRDFIQLLEKEFRYKGFIKDDQLEQFEKRVKAKLEQPERFIEKCLLMKQGSYKADVQIKNQSGAQREFPELKQEHIDDNNDYLYVDNLKKKQEKKEAHKGEDVDDLELFQQEHMQLKNLKSQVEVKKEDHSQEYIANKPVESQKEIKNQEESEPYSDNEDITVEECLQNLGTIILSTFSAQTLRHKPKQQKITVSLDNSFLKSPYNQIYIGAIPVEITKIEKTDIRKDVHGQHTAKPKKAK